MFYICMQGVMLAQSSEMYRALNPPERNKFTKSHKLNIILKPVTLTIAGKLCGICPSFEHNSGNYRFSIFFLL